MRYGGLIAAVVFAAIAAIVVMRMSGGDQQPSVAVAPQAVEQKTINVYIASRPIAIGSAITADDIATQPWPSHLALDGFIIADGKTNVIGMVARSPFQQSEPLINTKLANPNDPNFLAGDLPKGMRIVTIPINEIDGVAGFIFPGDAVDVLFTHDVDAWEYPPATADSSLMGRASAPTKIKKTVTETLLTNVKVVAIDQRSSSVGATNEKGALIVPRSASVMVSQSDAQRVRLAHKTGSLSLALRALADKDSADPLVLTSSGDISQSDTSGANGAGAEGIKIVRGAPATNKEVQPSGTSVSRGAAAGSSRISTPITALPSGGDIATPGLTAIP